MEQYQKHHQEHTHVLEDGTVVTHSHGREPQCTYQAVLNSYFPRNRPFGIYSPYGRRGQGLQRGADTAFCREISD